MTTDGRLPKDTDTTNSKGHYEINLKAPDSAGEYEIKAKFDGDSQYKSSDSSVKITVEETTLISQKNTVTTNRNTYEQQTNEQQTDKEPEE